MEQLLAFVEVQVLVGYDLRVIRKYHYVVPVPGNLFLTRCFRDIVPVLEPRSGYECPRSVAGPVLTPGSNPMCAVTLQSLWEVDFPCLWNRGTPEHHHPLGNR